AGAARTASLPPLQVEVAPAVTGGRGTGAVPGPGDSRAGAPPDAGEGWIRVPGVQGEVRPWAFATVLSALAWLLTLAWGLHREPPRPSGGDAPPVPPAEASAHARATLQRALDPGDLGGGADALSAAARGRARRCCSRWPGGCRAPGVCTAGGAGLPGAPRRRYPRRRGRRTRVRRSGARSTPAISATSPMPCARPRGRLRKASTKLRSGSP